MTPKEQIAEDIDKLREWISSILNGGFTSAALTQMMLERINRIEPSVKAMIEEEREACAKTAEDRAAMNKADDREARMERAACHQIAALIRQGNPEQNIPLIPPLIPGRIWGITEMPKPEGETVNFESKGD